MTRRLPILGASLVAALALTSLTGTKAEAGHVHFHWSGGVHVGSSVHVGGGYYSGYRSFARAPSWGVRGHIYVGPRYYYRPYYYYYYPEYVPSYYGASYYPVQPEQPTYAAPGVTVATVAPRPDLPRFGIGLFAGGVATDYNTETNTSETDLGVLGRFRITSGLVIEGELGRTSTSANGVDDVRVDRRLGGALLYEIGAYNRWAPFVLVGLGVQQAQVGDGAGGTDYTTTQDYGEIGAGIRFAVTRNLHLTFDLRAGTRSSVSSDKADTMPVGVARTITPPTPGDNSSSEDYTRARLSAILYF